ncbi:SIR2 family protein [Rothia sp. P5766]|uniref:SIR2 family protein n=1 Tax=Rothia sp. P5766 TaxID=3402656 RepID=UPI003AEB16F4
MIDSATHNDLVLFVGAGVSMESKIGNTSPPSWDKLLSSLSEVVNKSNNVDFNSILEKNLLEAAEFIRFESQKNGREQEVIDKILDLVDSPNGEQFKSNDWHDAIELLNPNIIITTNFDSILERKFPGYSKIDLTDLKNLPQKVRTRKSIIIKAHGTAGNPGTILSQGDYMRNLKDSHQLYDVINSLLLTRTCLFIGYSIGDLDFQVLLNNTKNSIHNNQISHYILTPEIPPYRKSMFRDAYGLHALEYTVNQNGSHQDGIEKLKSLGEIASTKGA